MPENEEIIPYSLCDDCPLNTDGKVCKETLIEPKVVLVCGNRAKHEAPNKEE
jgi:hypothetical protein